MLIITQILLDYEEVQCGITHMPQLSWSMESDKRNVVQDWYQVQIAADAGFENILYETGKVESDASAQVQLLGVILESCRRYYVRIQAAAAGEETEWAVSDFVTGLMDNAEWKAEYITAETESDKELSKSTYVRKEFAVKGKVKEAFACTTALGLYNFYINGRKVGMDELTPGWTTYNKHLCYQTYDVTEYLKEGANAMGAILAAGWFKGLMGMPSLEKRKNIYGDYTAFLMQMIIRYEDGSEETIVTDTSWMGNDAPVVFAEIYDGEIYDASKEIPGWAEAGLDTEKVLSVTNGTGMNADELRAAESLCMNADELRAAENLCVNADEPQAAESLCTNADQTLEAAKACGTNWHQVNIVEYSKEVLTGQGSGKVAEIEEVKPQSIFVTAQGHTVIDFGQNMSGHVQVTAEGKAGDVIRLHCFEALDTKGEVYLDNLRTAKETSAYIFGKEGKITYKSSFTYMGFRYVLIEEFPGQPKLENFTAYTLHTDMRPTGRWQCSNPDLNQLAHNVLWGMKSNFVDVPTDCPQRDERMGWTGDAQIFSRTASFLMNTYSFYSKWLTDVAADQAPEGGVPHVVPDIVSGNQGDDWLLGQGTHSAAAWADVATIMPWNMYLTFGDKEILKRQYASMKGWVDFMREHAEDYIWNYKLQFGDWVALDAAEGSYFGATPNDLTCTAYFAYSTGLFVKMANALGLEDVAAEYEEVYRKIVDKFQRTFFDSEGRLTAQTQTAHIVALYFGLTPEEYKETTVKGLLALLEKENGHLVTGFVGTPYFCHALSQNGCVKEAYDLLLKDDFPSWLYQVKMGATTVWEHWDGIRPDGTMWSAEMNSFNHYAYGAIGEWLVRVAAGLEIDEECTGYKHSIIYPRIGGGLTWVKGEYDSVYGTVESAWEQQGDNIVLCVKVPVNTTATICLDGAKSVLNADGLEFMPAADCMTAEAGSGEYRIVFAR